MNSGNINIRSYINGDAAKLYDVFYSSIRNNARAYYTQNQLKAWAPETLDLPKWEARIQAIKPFVVESNEMILAYADLQANGYIDHFFVAGGQAGKGIGKSLLLYIIERARAAQMPSITADVSLAAQGFFEQFGFKIVKRQMVDIRGEKLENALMIYNFELEEYKS